jgi:hypothetical protein
MKCYECYEESRVLEIERREADNFIGPQEYTVIEMSDDEIEVEIHTLSFEDEGRCPRHQKEVEEMLRWLVKPWNWFFLVIISAEEYGNGETGPMIREVRYLVPGPTREEAQAWYESGESGAQMGWAS